MWIGANQGLFFYDLKQKQLCSPFANRAAEDIRGCIGSIIDKNGQLWIGCLDGVYIIDLHSRPSSSSDGRFRYRHLKYKLDDPSSGLIEKICCFYEPRTVHYGWEATVTAFTSVCKTNAEKSNSSVITLFTACPTTASAVFWKMIKGISG